MNTSDWWTDSIEYDERSNTYRISCHGESLSTGIVMAVSLATGREPTDLPTLWEVIDPEALETVFEPGVAFGREPNAQVSFEYAGCRVVVRDDRSLVVSPTLVAHQD